MRRLIESGAVKGSNFVQVGLRGYWPPVDVFAWMQEHGLRWHLMREIEDRGSEAVIADAIAEALDGPDSVYLSIDIDVIDPGLAPGHRHARAGRHADPRGAPGDPPDRRRRCDLCGMDIVEVSPPYDHAETTAMAANRAALEAISALAVKKRAGRTVRWEPAGAVTGGRRREASGPESEADALARLYDLDLAEDPGDDIDLYLALAERTGGPILELAAGTGRIVRPLAAAGYAVTAVDLDPAMLARLGKPLAADHAGGRRPHDLAAEPPGVQACDPRPQRAVPDGRAPPPAGGDRSAGGRARAGGVAVVDIWLPDATDLARYDQRLLLDYIRTDPASGHTVTKTVAALHDAATATVLLTAIYDEGPPGGPAVRWIRRDLLRLIGAGELVDLARAAGLEVETLAGDYGLEPLGPGAERAILIAHRP